MEYDISLIGCDQRKIIGRRELANYAKLIDVSYASQVSRENGNRTVQLIDTPAFSLNPSDDCNSDLAKICQGVSTFVVLDASCRLKEMLRIVERARCFSPFAIAFTRLDVASQYGALYDVLQTTKLPLLGVSLSASFRTPFKFFEPMELATFFVRKGEK